MLSKAEFTDAIFDELRQKLPSNYSLFRKPVMKANDTPYTAFNITKEGNNVGIVLYAEHMYEEYQDGRSIEEIAEINADLAQHSMVEKESSIPPFDKQFVLDHVYFKMANAGMNQKRFEHVPVYAPPGAEDIALYPCVDVEIDGHYGVATITDDQISSLGISQEELHSAALANTERRMEIVPLSKVLKEMMPGIEEEAFESPFFVSRDKEAAGKGSGASLFGAPSVIKQMQGDYYIIPSSVHEVLLLPKDFEADTDRLHMIVHEVNRDILKPEDFLSDHVYVTKEGVINTLESDLTASKDIELND